MGNTHIRNDEPNGQLVLFPEVSRKESEAAAPQFEAKIRESKNPAPQPRSGLFGKAMLQETIDLLPRFPEAESLVEARDFLQNNLHFSGQSTRVRRAQYIVQRMFPLGYADAALRHFARLYAGKQELRDVCFYRFCQFERLMLDILNDLLLPNIGVGQLERNLLRDYLAHRFPGSANINGCALEIVNALVGAGLATADRLAISFAYRNISIPAFAFILHSEFPEPGMFDIGKLEQNQAIRSMLWKPGALLPALYELRNQNIISKVSEIDSVRQFTTRYTLDQVVEVLSTR